MESSITKYRKTKLEYLSKKNELARIKANLIAKNEELHNLQSTPNKVNEIATCTDEIKNLEKEETLIENQIPSFEKDVSNSKSDALNSNLNGYDTRDKNFTDLFKIDNINSNNYKEPHYMSDKDIINEFKLLKFNSIDWIRACPEWQQDRLMSLYDEFTTDSNKNFDDTVPNPYEAIISKTDSGFYQKIKNNTLSKKFTLELGNTVTLEPKSKNGNSRVIKYKNEHYICVRYITGKNLKNNTIDEIEGYVKTKNITLKSSTNDLLSTIQASQDDVQGLSAASSRWISKKKLFLTQDKNIPDNFHVNSDSNFPNPALMNDKEIAEHFKALIAKDKDEADKWIDAFFIHHNRMSSIYRRVINKTDSDLSEEKPQGIRGIIKDSRNANVYKLDNNNELVRFANMVEGNSVRVNIDPTSSNDVSFNFFKSGNKQYVPVLILFKGKVVSGYINSQRISLIVDDENSVLNKSSHTNAVNSNNDNSENIENLTKTLSKRSSSKPNILNIALDNPLTMSDKDIANYIKELETFDKIYSWADSYPFQTKRIKNIYNTIVSSNDDLKNIKDISIDKHNFDEAKTSQIIATITRDEAHVYPANSSGTGIEINSSKSTNKKQSITSTGILKKGGKVRVALDTTVSNGGTPTFIHHKDTAKKSTKYIKIQYLDSDLKYVDGFISVNAISTRTIEDDISELIDSIISDPIDDLYDVDTSLSDESQFDLGSVESLISSIGDSGFEFNDKTDPHTGESILDENGESVKDEVEGFDSSAYDTSVNSFSTFSSLLSVVSSLKNYCSAVSLNNILNEELVDMFSSTNGLVSSSLSLATSSISSTNSHVDNLNIANTVFSNINIGIDNIKFLYNEIPTIWNLIKHRESPDPEKALEKVMEILSLANSTLGAFSDLSSAIPIVSAAISILNSTIKFIYDLVKFVLVEIQIWKMYKQKNILKDESLQRRKALNPAAEAENKVQRAERLETINQEISKLKFKGKSRDDADNKNFENLKNERLEYMDLFLTTELENINKKRRNRRALIITQDLLNLTGDIAGLLSITIPEPTTILATSMVKLGTKAASAATDAGAKATRNIKQWYRDRNEDNPNSTKNKQKKYATVAAGMINNIINLPKPPIPPASSPNNPTYLQMKNFAEKRYLLVQSHIIASGTSISDLEKCNGDPKQMFRLLYSSLLTRE